MTALLYELAKPENKTIQDRVRAEIVTLCSADPSMEDINSLPYLDAVIREHMRCNPVIHMMVREANKDDIIPLFAPLIDKKGVERHEVRYAFATFKDPG